MKTRNPFKMVVPSTIVFFIVYEIVTFIVKQSLDILNALFAAVIFFVVSYFMQVYLNNRCERER